jgi:cytochrome b subunit of formate dehydrogenase
MYTIYLIELLIKKMKELNRYQALELVTYLPFFARITVSSWPMAVVLLFYLLISATFMYTSWFKQEYRGYSANYWLELKKLAGLSTIVAIAVESTYPGILVTVLAVASYYGWKTIYNQNVEKFAICILLFSNSSSFQLFIVLCLLYAHEAKVQKEYHARNKHNFFLNMTSNFIMATSGLSSYQVFIVLVTVICLTAIAMLNDKPNQFEERARGDEVYDI